MPRYSSRRKKRNLDARCRPNQGAPEELLCGKTPDKWWHHLSKSGPAVAVEVRPKNAVSTPIAESAESLCHRQTLNLMAKHREETRRRLEAERAAHEPDVRTRYRGDVPTVRAVPNAGWDKDFKAEANRHADWLAAERAANAARRAGA